MNAPRHAFLRINQSEPDARSGESIEVDAIYDFDPFGELIGIEVLFLPPLANETKEFVMTSQDGREHRVRYDSEADAATIELQPSADYSQEQVVVPATAHVLNGRLMRLDTF